MKLTYASWILLYLLLVKRAVTPRCSRHPEKMRPGVRSPTSDNLRGTCYSSTEGDGNTGGSRVVGDIGTSVSRAMRGSTRAELGDEHKGAALPPFTFALLSPLSSCTARGVASAVAGAGAGEDKVARAATAGAGADSEASGIWALCLPESIEIDGLSSRQLFRLRALAILACSPSFFKAAWADEPL